MDLDYREKMIKLIKFILYLLYRYYNKGKDFEIAYFSSVSFFILLIFMNLFALLGILSVDVNQLIPFSKNDARWMQYLKVAIFQAIPSYVLIYIFFKEESIKKLEYDESKIEAGNVCLIVYIILSIIAVIIWG